MMSYEVGMVKPDPGIYELTATRLDMLPEECVFVDDIERFCTAANEAGMKAVWHKDTNDTIAKIKELISA